MPVAEAMRRSAKGYGSTCIGVSARVYSKTLLPAQQCSPAWVTAPWREGTCGITERRLISLVKDTHHLHGLCMDDWRFIARFLEYDDFASIIHSDDEA